MLTKEENIAKEDNLVALLKNKDRQGYNMLYDNYAPTLLGVLMKIVGEQEAAEDLLQDVFVKIWNNIGSYDPKKGRLYTWMLNITRNTGIDKLRSKDFKKGEQNRPIDKYVNGIREDSLTSKTDTIGLKKLVEQLKPDQYTVIDMLYFKGYSQSETAEALGIPLGTVKTRARAALLELRTIIT